MSDFASEMVHRIQARIRELLHTANTKHAFSGVRLREFPASEPLPWDPCIPRSTPEELQLLSCLRQELNHELGTEEAVSDCDVLHFALQELQLKLRNDAREDVLLRLGYLLNVRHERID